MGNKKSEVKVVEPPAPAPAPAPAKKSKAKEKAKEPEAAAPVPVKKAIAKKDAPVETAVKAKVKKAKKERDPNAPKRPVSAFFLYAADERDKVKAEMPDAKPSAVMAEAGVRWQALKNGASPRVAHYEDIARKNREVYAEQVAAYKATLE